MVCVDDEWGRRLADLAGVPVLTVGRRDADWTWEPVRLTAAGGTVRVTDQAGETVDLDVALPGEFNLANAMLALMERLRTMRAAGLPTSDAARGIASVRAVPGRMERVDRGQPFATLVDYAHTPDALALLVRQARDLAGPCWSSSAVAVTAIVASARRWAQPRRRPTWPCSPATTRDPRTPRRSSRP